MKPVRLFAAVAAITFSSVPSGYAQMAGMAAMENSVGALSSGTSIEPRVSTETGSMVLRSFGPWSLMLHANAALVAVQQSGPRGGDKLFSANWVMPMLSRNIGRQTVAFRTMASLEPVTVTQRRYPELFQTGETAYGLPVVDGQHPHDLVMEFSARYTFRFSERRQFFVYWGAVGEPALGPTAFPHRASASENVAAPLGHHQQDSTHISNGVTTLGFATGRFQIEASGFQGREPNENRWNIDRLGRPNSFAARATVALNDRLSGQFSVGRINNREALHPDEDALKMTASVSHHTTFRAGHIATTLIWGRNKNLPGHDAPRVFNSYAMESTVRFLERNWAWARIENVDRDRTILVGETPAVLSIDEDPVGRVQAYTFGYERDLPWGISSVNLGIGAQFTAYGMPATIHAVYGERPIGFAMILRLRPKGNMAEHMKAMHGH